MGGPFQSLGQDSREAIPAGAMAGPLQSRETGEKVPFVLVNGGLSALPVGFAQVTRAWHPLRAMDKAFFETHADRQARFLERAGYPADQVRTEVVLGTGRTYILDAIVETADTWVQLDVREVESDTLLSIMLPYYQIHHVALVRSRARVPQTGFAG